MTAAFLHLIGERMRGAIERDRDVNLRGAMSGDRLPDRVVGVLDRRNLSAMTRRRH